MSKKPNYRLLISKNDPKLMLTLPNEIYEDIAEYAEKNARTRNQEIIARLARSLEMNDILMSKDRLMRLIFCKKLAYSPKSINQK